MIFLLPKILIEAVQTRKIYTHIRKNIYMYAPVLLHAYKTGYKWGIHCMDTSFSLTVNGGTAEDKRINSCLWSDPSGSLFELVIEKTNNLRSDQVRHIPGCTVTEDG